VDHVVAYRLVEIRDGFKQFRILRIGQKIGFVDHDYCLDTIGLGCRQKAVYECCGCDRIGKRHNQTRLIEIGRYDVGFFGKIACAADYIVFPGHDLGDICRSVGIDGYAYAVAHGNRVGRADSFEAEMSFDLAGVILA
jgi:hypothetical protein